MKNLKIILILFCLVFSSTLTNAKTLRFAVASDVHYSLNKESNSMSESAKVLRGFVDRVNENKYDFVIFLGDNIEKSNKENLSGFLHQIKGIKGTPYYLVLGNRDAHKISGLAKPEYLEIVSKLNRNQKKADTSYYFYPNKDIIVIVLDGSSSGMPSTHGVFTQKTLQWLDQVLTKNKNKTAIIFQHFPYMEPYLKPSHEILDKMSYKTIITLHDNVFMIVSGHYHKEGVFKDDKDIYHISAPALYMPPYNYQEFVINYDKPLFSKLKNIKLEGTQKPAI